LSSVEVLPGGDSISTVACANEKTILPASGAGVVVARAAAAPKPNTQRIAGAHLHLQNAPIRVHVRDEAENSAARIVGAQAFPAAQP
jgi:hypothetical protein